MFRFAVYPTLEIDCNRLYLILLETQDPVLPVDGLLEGYCPELEKMVEFNAEDIKHTHYLGV